MYFVNNYNLMEYHFLIHYPYAPKNDYKPPLYKVERLIYNEMNYLSTTVHIEDEEENEKECERLEGELLKAIFEDGYYNFGDFELLAEKWKLN